MGLALAVHVKVSLLKNLSGLGIGLPMKIKTDELVAAVTLVPCMG
jgi:hypothetical protein